MGWLCIHSSGGRSNILNSRFGCKKLVCHVDRCRFCYNLASVTCTLPPQRTDDAKHPFIWLGVLLAWTKKGLDKSTCKCGTDRLVCCGFDGSSLLFSDDGFVVHCFFGGSNSQKGIFAFTTLATIVPSGIAQCFDLAPGLHPPQCLRCLGIR